MAVRCNEVTVMGAERDAKWAALLRQANGGDRSAYALWLKDITPVLRGIIRARHGGTADDCEDILQISLIAIHEKRHTWRDGDPVGPWIYAIARYKTIDALRARRRNPTTGFDGAEAEISDETVSDPTFGHDLDRLLLHLDPATAAIVRRIKLEGYTAEEVGATTGMTPGAVRVALHRALAHLAQVTREGSVPDRGGPR